MFKIIFTIALFYNCLAIGDARTTRRKGAIRFSDCPPEVVVDGKLENVIIPSCGQPPCSFNRGETFHVELDFENTWNTTTLVPRVFANIGGVIVAWPGMDSDGCDDMLIGSCPLYVSDYVTYGIDLYIEPTYPQIDVTLRWLMEGDDGKGIFCWEIPVKVK